jgi:periplasmic iron binding protein
MKRESIALRLAFLAALVIAFAWRPAAAAEQPAGVPLEINGLKVMAVYLQPVEMAPAMPGQNPAKSDIHLEADIHATGGNKNGFPIEAWIPYLRVHFTLTKKGSDWKAEGRLSPMVANDGPHYGANIRLDGPGAYDLVLHIAPPRGRVFGRHIEKETGVAVWWAPFDYKGRFNFVGVGKIGGY